MAQCCLSDISHRLGDIDDNDNDDIDNILKMGFLHVEDQYWENGVFLGQGKAFKSIALGKKSPKLVLRPKLKRNLQGRGALKIR